MDHVSRVDRLFDELCELPPEERGPVLEACEDDGVRDEVVRLLAQFDRTGSGLDEGVDRVLSAASSTLPGSIGRYEIRSLLGEGGMGVVYLAEQQSPQREVALKVLRAGALGGERTRRFEREAELLGRLQHPNIAQIFESGTRTDASGTVAFIAMEFIDGAPLSEFAEREGLDTEARTRLLVSLAEAVHHAHLRSVIHRDLKPGNVLVDSSGQVKVIDFGIGRAMDADLDASMRTMTGQVFGTLAYMSPEQVRGANEDIDARTDVYALGVMAYELFSGQLPHDVRGLTITQAARIVLEEEPELLGKRRPACRGDLEQIVARAMEREPGRRYQSAAALADDLRRYLDHEPITARAPSAIYQLRKVAQRHRTLVGGATATLIALVVGAVVSVSYGIRNAELARLEADARRDAVEAADEARGQAALAKENEAKANANAERAREMAELAEERLERQQRLTEFQSKQIERVDLSQMGAGIKDDLLAEARAEVQRAGPSGWTESDVARLEELLPGVNPINLARRTLLHSILRETRKAIDEEYADDPAEYSELLDSHSKVLLDLGFDQEYLETNLHLLEVMREAFGPDSARAIAASVYAVTGYLRVRDYRNASELLDSIKDRVGEALGRNSPITRQMLSQRGILGLLTGDFADSEAAFREQLELVRESEGDAASQERVLRNLSMAVLEQGRPEEAEQLMREAIELVPGPATPEALHFLGTCILRQGRPADAAELFEEAVEGHIRQFGATHPKTLLAKQNLSSSYGALGRYAEGEALLREILEVRLQRPVVEAAETARVESYLSEAVLLQGRGEEALELVSVALSRARQHLGEDHPMTLQIKKDLSRTQAAVHPEEE